MDLPNIISVSWDPSGRFLSIVNPGNSYFAIYNAYGAVQIKDSLANI